VSNTILEQGSAIDAALIGQLLAAIQANNSQFLLPGIDSS
jgi:hypothetical protein